MSLGSDGPGPRSASKEGEHEVAALEGDHRELDLRVFRCLPILVGRQRARALSELPLAEEQLHSEEFAIVGLGSAEVRDEEGLRLLHSSQDTFLAVSTALEACIIADSYFPACRSSIPCRTDSPTLHDREEEEADDGARTRDPWLGKPMLYQLSYVRRIPAIVARP
jgi:hypothetical protein